MVVPCTKFSRIQIHDRSRRKNTSGHILYIKNVYFCQKIIDENTKRPMGRPEKMEGKPSS